MSRIRRKSDLSRPWQIFITACQNLNFGHLEDVQFDHGEPAGRLHTHKTYAFGANKANDAASEANDPHAELRPAWVEVIALAASRPYLMVRRFEVAHGNPLKLSVEDWVEVTLA